MTKTVQTINCPDPKCGQPCEYRQGDLHAVCHNKAAHVIDHPFILPSKLPEGACPRCKQQNGPLSSVYVSAFDSYQDMCNSCRSTYARQSAWILSGMAKKTGQILPPQDRL